MLIWACVQYGSVVTWGIPIDLHSEVVFNLAGEFLEDPKDYGAIQADSMRVQVVDGAVKPSIRNDTIHLHHELFGARKKTKKELPLLHQMKLLRCSNVLADVFEFKPLYMEISL